MSKIMKSLILTLMIGLFSFSFSNESIKMNKIDENVQRSYPIDPRPFLEKTDKIAREYFEKHPDYLKSNKLQKTSAWNFVVGDTKNWWTYDMVNLDFVRVPSTCRAVGEHCYIFVEDAMWDSTITQAGVDSVKIAFDSKTPANSNKGIYQMDTETFGNPPDVDNDPKIIILILDIIDGYDGTGGYVAGYFHSHNELPASILGSNKAEIYYLDADPANLLSSSGLQNGISTTAHEFQHMIHYNYDQNEETFVNEGLSMIAEVVCGFNMREQTSYANETNIYLFEWRGDDNVAVLSDYSRAALFTLYIKEQIGGDILKQIVQNTSNGIYGYNSALSQVTPSTSLRFDDIVQNWFLANIVGDTSINPAWGYTYSGIKKVVGIQNINPNVTNTTISVENLSSQYLRYKFGSDLKIYFDESESDLSVKVIKVDTNDVKEVVNVVSNDTLTFPEYGEKYKEIDFAIINENHYQDKSIDYTSSGAAPEATEVKYDDYPPAGVLLLSDQDTICVVFDDILGKKLDSIKVALRQPGSVTGGVWKYTGASRPTPLGEQLTSITATSTISEKPPYPYPEPWPNWITIDLTSENISGSEPFVVGFLVEGTYPEYNRVMITEQPGQSAYHSYTYLHDPSSGNPDWYYISASDTSIYVYLIRAYLSESPILPVIKEFTADKNEILLGEKITLNWEVKNADQISINGVNSDTNLVSSLDVYPDKDTTYILTAINGDGETSSDPIYIKVNVLFELYQNQPNPFNGSTTIPFDIETDSNVKLVIYNILGQKVNTILNKNCSTGHYDITWNGTNNYGNQVPSGIYFYKIVNDSNIKVKKMVYIK